MASHKAIKKEIIFPLSFLSSTVRESLSLAGAKRTGNLLQHRLLVELQGRTETKMELVAFIIRSSSHPRLRANWTSVIYLTSTWLACPDWTGIGGDRLSFKRRLESHSLFTILREQSIFNLNPSELEESAYWHASPSSERFFCPNYLLLSSYSLKSLFALSQKWYKGATPDLLGYSSAFPFLPLSFALFSLTKVRDPLSICSIDHPARIWPWTESVFDYQLFLRTFLIGLPPFPFL